MYKDIFFAQEHEALEWLDHLDENGPNVVLKEMLHLYVYPMEDIMGEDIREEEPWGSSDERYSMKDFRGEEYILSWNERFGYIALTKVVEEDE